MISLFEAEHFFGCNSINWIFTERDYEKLLFLGQESGKLREKISFGIEFRNLLEAIRANLQENIEEA